MLLGISVYPEKDRPEKVLAYIDLAHKEGFRALFLNLLGTLNDPQQLAAIGTICRHASKRKWRVTADVSPNALKGLCIALDTAKADTFFTDLGVNTLRLDEDFGGVLETAFTKKNKRLALQVNASSFTDIGAKMKAKGADLSRVTACHNFYPQRETGLALSYFEDANDDFANLGIPVEAFLALPSRKNNIGPWAQDDGLPTLEVQRGRSLSYQTRLLCAEGSVSALHFASMYATEAEFRTVARFAKDQLGFVISPDKGITKAERAVTFGYAEHVVRGDIAENMIRSTMTRIKFKDESFPARTYSGKKFVCGDVLVVNDRLPRYKGELQIVTGEIANDGTRNLVGRIPADELDLMLYIRPWRKFTLYEQ